MIKEILFTIGFVLLSVLLLLFPKESMSYAREGLILWYQNMVPALFPFMVLSSLAIKTNIIPRLSNIYKFILRPIFRTNHYCEYAIFMGFICGFPIGAVIIKELLCSQKISLRQAEFLLCFCNNIGPVFIFSILLPPFSAMEKFILLLGLYGIPFLTGIILRYTKYKNDFVLISSHSKDVQTTADIHPFMNHFSESISSCATSILYLCGCMVIFNMLRFLPELLPINKINKGILSCLLEINAATDFIFKTIYPQSRKLSICFVSTFHLGGLSCLAQTAGILNGSGCSFSKYVTAKLFQTIAFFLLGILFLFIFAK